MNETFYLFLSFVSIIILLIANTICMFANLSRIRRQLTMMQHFIVVNEMYKDHLDERDDYLENNVGIKDDDYADVISEHRAMMISLLLQYDDVLKNFNGGMK